MNTETLYNELIKPKLIAEHSEAKVIPLSEIDALIGAPLKLIVPQGDVTPTGIASIRNYLFSNVVGCRYSYAHVPPEESEDENGFKWVWLDPKYGTLPKRIGKWLAKKSGRAPNPKVLSEVGNIARRNSDDNQAYYFRIVNEIDWSAEMFGKPGGGCWWGANGGSRSSGHPESNSNAKKFIERGGLGVQFFKSEDYKYSNGIGRLWLLREPEQAQWAVCFNGYWDNEGATLRLSRVLATYLGLSYKKCQRLTNSPNATDGTLYINDGHGYFVASTEEIGKLGSNAVLPRRVPRAPCGHCGLSTELDYLTQGYCTTCWTAVTERCVRCGARRLKTEFLVLRESKGLVRMCGSCVSQRGYRCHCCLTNWVARDYSFKGSIKVDGYFQCTRCTMAARKCQDCGIYTQNSDAMDDPLCKNCEESFEQEIGIPVDYEDIESMTFGSASATGERINNVTLSRAQMRRIFNENREEAT